jgi:hypothetical protein
MQNTLHNGDLFHFHSIHVESDCRAFSLFWFDFSGRKLLEDQDQGSAPWIGLHYGPKMITVNDWETSPTLLIFKTQITTTELLKPKLNSMSVNYFVTKYVTEISYGLHCASSKLELIQVNYTHLFFFQLPSDSPNVRKIYNKIKLLSQLNRGKSVLQSDI